MDQHALAKVLTTVKHGLNGVFVKETITRTRWFGIQKSIDETFTIYVLSHLPRKRLESVLAHELTHAWQAENCIADQSLMMKEGIAELISYLYGKNFRLHLSNKIAKKNRYAAYREGLKKALKLHKKYGLRNLLIKIRKCKRFSELGV